MALLLDVLAAGVVDSSNNPLESGKAFVYSTGTTTLTDVFQDADLTLNHTNPIILDSVGRSEAYVPGDVRILIKDSDDVTVLDIDSIGSTTAATGDFIIGNSASDNLVLAASVQGDLRPSITDTYSVGSAALRWLKGWFSGLSVNGDVGVTGDVSITGTGTHNVSAEFANEVYDSYTRPTSAPTVLERGVAISDSSGTFSTSSASYVPVTNLEVTITTIGRPVALFLKPDSASVQANIYAIDVSGANANAKFRFVRDTTALGDHQLAMFSGGSSSVQIYSPLGCVLDVDATPPAGTYTYTVEIKASAGSAGLFYGNLVAVEL